jgi:hypothetical protein
VTIVVFIVTVVALGVFAALAFRRTGEAAARMRPWGAVYRSCRSMTSNVRATKAGAARVRRRAVAGEPRDAWTGSSPSDGTARDGLWAFTPDRRCRPIGR